MLRLVCLLPLLLAAHVFGQSGTRSVQEPVPTPSVGTREPGPQFWAGAAEIDITPDYPIRLSGFGSRRAESEGVRQRIFARALVLGFNNERFVLVSVDNLAVDSRIRQQRQFVMQMCLGLNNFRDLKSLALTATHTHTAPMLRDICPTLFGVPISAEHQKIISRYTAEFEGKLHEVAKAALSKLQPATLSHAVGSVPFAMNRRTKGGPVDHDLPLLAVRATKDGKLIALWTSYACHAVTLSDNRISGDWPGYAAELAQRRHPGAICLVSIGCGADQNPTSGVTGGNEDKAREQGALIADEIDRLLKTPMRPITAPLAAKEKTIALPLAKLPTQAEWEERAKRPDAIGHHARTMLETLRQGGELPTEIRYPISTWTFGDQLALVFLPGEVVVDFSSRLKDELDRSRIWLNAYSNDSPGYVPSERILKEGSYEGGGAMVYYGIPGPYAPGLEDKIVGTVKELLGSAFASPIDAKKLAGTKPLSPQQSLATLHTPHPSLEIELVAAEPLVTSPVAIDWGLDGKLYVAEMRDYPSGLPGHSGPGGRIRVLSKSSLSRDREGAGRYASRPQEPLPHGRGSDDSYDKSEVFLDNIPFPTGVTSWRKGLLICAAPDILYAEDTDGDGKADVVRKLYSGFGTHNFQARVNSLEYGLDGWIYGACGLFGGNIKSHLTGKTYPLGDRDFRIKPETGEIEAVQGRTQQGRTRDDWGNWFGCDNSNLAWHYPLDEAMLRRNPYLTPPPAAVLVPEGPEPNRVYPRGALQLFALSGPPGLATAACGLAAYRDNLLGFQFQNDLFVCEPVNLLVHRMALESNDSTFVGRRAEEEKQSEFLTSTDPWFRPVQAKTGPDGALYIVDMHRFVIEHPQWIPEAERAKLDLRAGSEMGRIFRVRPKSKPLRSVPRLDRMSPAELVAALETPNGWVRDRAAEQLKPFQDVAQTELLLRGRFLQSKRAVTRLTALTLLGENDLVDHTLAQRGIHDADSSVRRWAIRWSKPLWKSHPQLALETTIGYFFGNRKRPEISVMGRSREEMLQAAYFMFDRADDKKVDGWIFVTLALAQDPYGAAALESGLNRQTAPVVARSLLERLDRPNPVRGATVLLATTASYAIKTGDEATLDLLAESIAAPKRGAHRKWQFAAAGHCLAEAQRNPDLAPKLVRRFQPLLEAARQQALDAGQEEENRVVAVSCLGFGPLGSKEVDALAASLLAPQTPAPVQAAALELLGRLPAAPDHATAAGLWGPLSPALKNQLLDLYLARPAWTPALVELIEKNSIPASGFDAARRQRLLAAAPSEMKPRAERLFAGASNPDRLKALAAFADVEKLPGDRERGRRVFAKSCAACHRLGDVGHAVGPDLAMVANKSPGYLLQEMLDPNRNIDSRYVEYVALLKSGKLATGLVASESSHSVTLRGQEGKEQILLRADLEEFKSTAKSLMPEGLEKDLSKQDLADVIAFLRPAPAQPARQPDLSARGHRASADPPPATPFNADVVAKFLLDDTKPAKDRSAAIAAHLDHAPALLTAMTKDLKPGDTAEENRRIPWLWRVAIAAGKKDDRKLHLAVLKASLPEAAQPIWGWQAVVLGGGLINGVSQQSRWPKPHFAELVKDDPALHARWERALVQAATMADDEKVIPGTRYDALRMVALRAWADAKPQLLKYLAKGINEELQQGAVSGLSDIEESHVGDILVNRLADLSPNNRAIALDALLRTEERTGKLRAKLADGSLPATWLSPAQKKALKM